MKKSIIRNSIITIGALFSMGIAMADMPDGPGKSAGDVTIVNNGSYISSIVLVCDNGPTVNYGSFGQGESRNATSGALGACAGHNIYPQGLSTCKTPYNPTWAAFTFEVNYSSKACAIHNT